MAREPETTMDELVALLDRACKDNITVRFTPHELSTTSGFGEELADGDNVVDALYSLLENQVRSNDDD